MNEMTNPARLIELEREDAARRALEEAANILEIKPGAEQYQRAWRIAANMLRALRPKVT